MRFLYLSWLLTSWRSEFVLRVQSSPFQDYRFLLRYKHLPGIITVRADIGAGSERTTNCRGRRLG